MNITTTYNASNKKFYGTLYPDSYADKALSLLSANKLEEAASTLNEFISLEKQFRFSTQELPNLLDAMMQTAAKYASYGKLEIAIEFAQAAIDLQEKTTYSNIDAYLTLAYYKLEKHTSTPAFTKESALMHFEEGAKEALTTLHDARIVLERLPPSPYKSTRKIILLFYTSLHYFVLNNQIEATKMLDLCSSEIKEINETKLHILVPLVRALSPWINAEYQREYLYLMRDIK